MLALNALHCQVGNRTLLKVDQLNFQPGQMTALLGPNGAGKSTLMKTIAGDMPYQGNIALHGKLLREWDQQALARHVAVLPQSSSLSFPFIAKEVVQLGAIPLTMGRAELEQRSRDVMQRCDCLHLSNNRYTSLSGGERQRVQMARVLLQLSQAEQPGVLLLDEPTSAQDLGQQHFLLQQLRQQCHSSQWVIIAVLHDMNQVLHYCDQAVILSHGQPAEHGAVEQLLQEQVIEKYWGYRPSTFTNNEQQCALF